MGPVGALWSLVFCFHLFLSIARRHGALSARFFFLEHTGGTAELQLEDKALLQLSPLVAALLVGLPSC